MKVYNYNVLLVTRIVKLNTIILSAHYAWFTRGGSHNYSDLGGGGWCIQFWKFDIILLLKTMTVYHDNYPKLLQCQNLMHVPRKLS